MKRTIADILLFTLVLCIGVLPFIPAVAESEVSATVLFTNDTKGFTEDLGYIQRYKEETKDALLINCGNFTKGSAEASLSNAKFSSRLMQAAGYDFISLGTDDFAYGFRALKRYADYTGCTILSGNISYSSADVFAPNTVKTIGEKTIGFFSLCDGKCQNFMPTARKDGYRFAEELAFAREQVEALAGKCDKVVCMASFADNNADFTPEKLAQAVSGIDVLICSNTGESMQKTVGDTLIISADAMLGSLGKIELLSDGTLRAAILPKYLKDNTGKVLEETAGTYREYGDSPLYRTKRDETMEEFEKTLDSLVALNKTTIFGVDDKIPISQLEETPLGDLYADAIAQAGDKFKASESKYKDYRIVSIVNGSAPVQNIGSGEIYIRDVFNSRGIAEDVYFYECNAKQLFDLMEKSVAPIRYNAKTDYIYNPSAYFLQISGFNIIVDPTAKSGKKVIKMYLKDGDDEIVVKRGDDTKFLIGLNESLAKGFAGYDEFISLKPIYVGDFLTNYVRTAIASNVSEDYYISPGTESRITFKRIEQLQPNGDAWATIGKEYEDYAAAEVLVDGIDNMDCSQVDENGEVRITMTTGAHGVTVNGEDIYVSTASGIGLKKKSVTPIVDYKLYYKTLDDAYKIDESKYDDEAVKGYFEYLGRAFVQTKLTEEGEVVKATQDIYNVWDDFLENPDSFIKEENEEVEEEEEEASAYPNLEDFAYKGDFESNVFENTPKTTYSGYQRRTQQSTDSAKQAQATQSDTGDAVAVVLYVCAAALAAAAVSIAIYLVKKNRGKGKK